MVRALGPESTDIGATPPNFIEQTAQCDHKPRAAWVFKAKAAQPPWHSHMQGHHKKARGIHFADPVAGDQLQQRVLSNHHKARFAPRRVHLKAPKMPKSGYD